jgi:predicted RecB family nuclease
MEVKTPSRSDAIVCSYSELDSYRQCQLKHRIGYFERWRVAETTSPALNRGKLFHSVIEEHYLMQRLAQRGELTEARFTEGKQKIIELLHDENGNQDEHQERVQWMYDGYLEHYGVDPNWKVIAVEHKLEEFLPTDKGGTSRIKLKGTIDLIVKDREMGGLWIVDHKTCKNLPKGRETDLDDQFGIYQWLLRKRGNDIRGIIYNAVRTEKLKTRDMDSDERFKRIITVRTDRELDSIAVEAYQHLRRAWTDGLAGTPAPRSPNGDTCRWRCDYTEVCLAGRKGTDMRAMLSGMGFQQDFDRH